MFNSSLRRNRATHDPEGSRHVPTSWIVAGLPVLGALAIASADIIDTQAATALASPAQGSAIIQAAPVNQPLAQPPARTPGFSFANLVERASPAVVSVQVDREENMRLSGLDALPGDMRQFFRRFNQQTPSRGNNAPSLRSQAAGSGFIIDADGYIVTNNHVVQSARRIRVKLADKREFEAKLIGADTDTDVALLKVEARNLPFVALGEDRHLRAGDWVVAVGNPFGLGGTVTAGIVSSIGRDIGSGPYTDYIQIDAPINQGNSGGPTFDLSGRVVGMNTAIYSPSGGSVGIGFAVPASTIRSVVDQLRTHGSVDRGWLGVQIQNFTPEMASSLGMADAKGAIVADVVENSPAQRAGFRQGDVVLVLNGEPVTESRDLTRRVADLRSGERATFVVWRDGARRELVATIEKRDSGRVASAAPASENTASSLGMTLAPINPGLRQEYELDDKVVGVVITAVDRNSEAAEKGLQPGDVIVKAGNMPVRLPSDVTRGITQAREAGRQSVLLLVAGDQGEHFVALKIS